MLVAIRVLAEVANAGERIDQTLQHLRRELEHAGWRAIGVNVDFFIAHRNPGVNKVTGRVRKVPVGDELVVNELSAAFAEEVRLNEARGRFEDFGDDIRKLLFGVRNVHVLVITEQRRLPALFLQPIDQPGAAPTDEMLVQIARSPKATARGDRFPYFRDIGENVVESVARMLRTAPRLECARGYVGHPTSVRWPNVFDDVFVVVGLLVNQKLCELRTGNDSCHNSLKVFGRFLCMHTMCRQNFRELLGVPTP